MPAQANSLPQRPNGQGRRHQPYSYDTIEQSRPPRPALSQVSRRRDPTYAIRPSVACASQPASKSRQTKCRKHMHCLRGYGAFSRSSFPPLGPFGL
jgi:hypothetical protein